MQTFRPHPAKPGSPAWLNTLRHLACALCFSLSAATSTFAADRPNIVVVLADDLGYGDLGCYGNAIVKTPHLDRFAGEGLRLTSCYAGHANCSPSRTALMTGRNPTRVGVRNWIPFLSPMHVRTNEVTVATLLRKQGYTTAHVGKWHLNGWFNLPGQPQPGDHGFDHWFSTQNNCLPNHRNPYNFVRNGIPLGPQEGYASQIVVREAARWLKEERDRTKPFFLFVCFHEPHEPIATEKRFADAYPSDDPSYSAFWGNIAQLDESFGRLMGALDELKLRENTLVWFTSDNGPAITGVHPHGSAGPFRDKKGSLYEGGIRVPGMLRWPGRTKPGSESDVPISGVDLLPTLCAITGAPLPNDRAIDGASWLPVLEGKPVVRRTPLYWHFNQAHSKAKAAMRVGDWKILATLTGPEGRPGGDLDADEQAAMKVAELDTFELYNLKTDIGETTDRASQEPGRLQEMAAVLQRLYREVRDESPVWPAWEFARYEGQRIEWPPYRGKRPAKGK
jgi:arylsulfatase A